MNIKFKYEYKKIQAAIYKNYEILYYLKRIDNTSGKMDMNEINSPFGGSLSPNINANVNTNVNVGTNGDSNMDNLSYNGACILEEINKSKEEEEDEEIKKAHQILLLDTEDVSTSMNFKLEWNKRDRWNKSCLNYLQEAMNEIQQRLIVNKNSNDTVKKNKNNTNKEKEKEYEKGKENLLEDKKDLEKAINELFTNSYIDM